MAKILKTAALVLFAMCSVGNVSAQDSVGAPDKIVLEAKAGSVMTSAGGEYQTAGVGKLLTSGESIMLGDAATATVVYYYLDSDGDVSRKCTTKYKGANTYVIDQNCCECMAAAWVPGANRGGAAIIVGAGLIGAAILNGMDDVPPGPLSTGPNGSIRHL